MGMFSALKKKAPNATICFLTSKMMAVKNWMVACLDNMTTERRENIMKFATTHGRRQRQQKWSKQSVLRAEMMKRIAANKAQKATKQTKQMERELTPGPVQDIVHRSSLDTHRQEDLTDILEWRIAGVTLAMRGRTPRMVYASCTMAGHKAAEEVGNIRDCLLVTEWDVCEFDREET